MIFVLFSGGWKFCEGAKKILRKRQPELVDAPNENHPPLIILSIIFKEKNIIFQF